VKGGDVGLVVIDLVANRDRRVIWTNGGGGVFLTVRGPLVCPSPGFPAFAGGKGIDRYRATGDGRIIQRALAAQPLVARRYQQQRLTQADLSFLIRRQALPRIADYLGTRIVFSVDDTLILAENHRLVIIRNISGNRSQCRQRAMKLSCVFCNGLGRQLGDFDLMCPICEGHGSLEITGNPSLHRCHFCHGYGRGVGTFGPSCPICKGFGQLTEDRKPPTLSKSNPPTEPVPPSGLTLIADSRLAELRTCAHSQLDYRKLIRLCDELNTTFSQGCYLAVIMLTRSLLDHPYSAKAHSAKSRITMAVDHSKTLCSFSMGPPARSPMVSCTG